MTRLHLKVHVSPVDTKTGGNYTKINATTMTNDPTQGKEIGQLIKGKHIRIHTSPMDTIGGNSD